MVVNLTLVLGYFFGAFCRFWVAVDQQRAIHFAEACTVVAAFADPILVSVEVSIGRAVSVVVALAGAAICFFANDQCVLAFVKNRDAAIRGNMFDLSKRSSAEQ